MKIIPYKFRASEAPFWVDNQQEHSNLKKINRNGSSKTICLTYFAFFKHFLQ